MVDKGIRVVDKMVDKGIRVVDKMVDKRYISGRESGRLLFTPLLL